MTTTNTTTEDFPAIKLTDLLLTAPNQAKYNCGRCEGWYLDEESLIEHTNLCHEYWCLICNSRIKSESELKLHMEIIHCKKNRCDFCRLKFKNTDNFVKHMLDQHTVTRDKFASISRPSSSLLIRSPSNINKQVQNTASVPRQLTRNTSAKKNDQNHVEVKKSSEYLCAKCNLKFKNLKEIAQHMITLHNVEIGIRKFRSSSKEEIFIMGKKGKITESTALLKEIPNSSTSNGRSAPPSLTTYQNSTPILPSGSIIQNGKVNGHMQLPRLTKVEVPSSSNFSNRVTMVNTNSLPAQNGASPNLLPVSLTPINSKKRKNKPKECKHCGKLLSSNYSLNRHYMTVHKSLTQKAESTSSNLRIDRVLTPSEIQAFDLHSTNKLVLNSPTSQSTSNQSDIDSYESMHIEVELDNENDDVEIINENTEHNTTEVIHEIDSDSDMEIQVLSEPDPEPVVPKPMPYIRVQPSKRFLSKLGNQRTRTPINKQDIAERLQKINRQLSLKNKIMLPS